MKNRFFGSYKLNEQELRDFFSNSQFFFDTNALLSIYRVKKDMAKKIILSIAKQKDRTSITYHVAEEYHKRVVEQHARRLNEAKKMQELCADSDKLMDNIFSASFLNYIQQEEKTTLKKIIGNFSADVTPFLEEKFNEFNEEFKSMEIAGLLAKELADCIIDPLPKERIEQLKEEFKSRTTTKTPPGYKDKSKAKEDTNTQTNEAGDYIIWTEMIQWAAANKKDILFITNEEKEDWVWSECGLRIGPRRELCYEFNERTNGQRFYLIKLDTFLTLTEDKYTESEIKEIKEEIILKPRIKADSNSILSIIVELSRFKDTFGPPEHLRVFLDKYKSQYNRISLETAKRMPNTSTPYDESYKSQTKKDSNQDSSKDSQ